MRVRWGWNWRKLLVYAAGLLMMAASVLVYRQYLQRLESDVTMTRLLQPVRFIQAGEVIGPGVLQYVSGPQAAHRDEAYVRAEEVVGKTALVPIGPGEELLRWKLADVALVPREGERYYSFKTDRLQNNANLIRNGDRVDVWVEFDSPKWLKDAGGDRVQVAGVKLIENLLVAGVKTAEGVEVSDSGGLEQMLGAPRTSRASLLQSRSKPSGVPEMNTYIMSEEVYNAYVLGSIGGRIKLALPDWNRPIGSDESGMTRLTELYEELRGTDIFNREGKKQEVTVSHIPPSEIAGGSGAGGSGGSQERGSSPAERE